MELPGDAGGVEALPPKILNMTVPQVGQRPLMALRPFFIISSTASEISFLALHLTQYPSGIKLFYSKRLTRLAMRIPYGAAVRSVNSENRCQHGRRGQIPKPDARPVPDLIEDGSGVFGVWISFGCWHSNFQSME